MKTLVTFESFYGNTEKIARKIAESVGMPDEVNISLVKEIKNEDLDGVELLIIGSPTHGFRPCPDTLAFLRNLPGDALNNVNVAAFES